MFAILCMFTEGSEKLLNFSAIFVKKQLELKLRKWQPKGATICFNFSTDFFLKNGTGIKDLAIEGCNKNPLISAPNFSKKIGTEIKDLAIEGCNKKS